MKNLSLILFIFCFSNAFCQQVVNTFGKFTDDEINMTSYEKDKDAKAVVLFDKGRVEFSELHGSRATTFRRHKRVKVFDKSVKGQFTVGIPYYKNKRLKSDEVTNITAITYNFVDGNQMMRKIEPSEIFDEQLSNNVWQKKFVFPNVQDGSILEYKYNLQSLRLFSLPKWHFQDNIPTIYSEYEARIIPVYEYVYLAQGIDEFDYENVRTDGHDKLITTNHINDVVYNLAKKDIPAFIEQPYVTSPEDYIMKIEFQLARRANLSGGVDEIISNWPKLNSTYLKHEYFGLYMKGSKKYAKNIGQELGLDQLSKQEKAKKIINYVKSNFEWDGRHRKFADQSPKQFFNTKVGSSAEINLFTIGLLNGLDIITHPIVLSTRDHGKIPTSYPFDRFTNYVIMMVEGDKLFLADATEDLLPYNRIPTKCINNKGLVVNDKEEVDWINLESNFGSLEKKSINMILNPETMDIDTKISIQSIGYESYYNRSYFRDDTLKIKDYYEDKVGDINRMKTINYNKNIVNPYNIFLIGNCETEKFGGKVIVKPFLNLPMSENLLKEEVRNYPVDFIYANNEEYITNLQIPSTHTIKSLPDNYAVKDDLVELSVSYSYENNSLTAHGNANFKKAIYSVQEYSKLRAHFDMMVKYFNQAVIVEEVN